MTGVIAFLYASGPLVFPDFLLFSSGAVPSVSEELSPVRVPGVSSLLLCLFLCLSVASSLYAPDDEQLQDGQSIWTLGEAQQPISQHSPQLHHYYHYPFRSTKRRTIRFVPHPTCSKQNNSLFSPHYMFLVFAPDFFLGYLVCHPRLQNPFCLQTANCSRCTKIFTVELDMVFFFP